MAENTITLQSLRRKIASELQMPFARRFPAGYGTVDVSSTSTKILDAALTQAEGFWNGSWFYHVPTQSISYIRAYTPVGGGNFQLEVPVTGGAPTAGDQYEIHSIFNAADIASAVNRAINAVQRVFIDTVTDQSLIVTQNTLTYSLSSLSKKPWIVTKVWLENKPMMRGSVVSATSTTTTLNSDMSSIMTIPTNYILSIYAGTGAGQQRNVVSVAGAVITTAAWTTIPDSTSLFALWDSTYELQDWRLLAEYHLDAKEWPDTLYLDKRMPSWYGARLRLEYMAVPSELSTETSTTIVPSEYIVPKALGILYGQRSKDTKVDQKTFQLEAQRYDKMAEDYLVRNMPRKPDITLKTPVQTDTFIENDPMNWNGWNR